MQEREMHYSALLRRDFNTWFCKYYSGAHGREFWRLFKKYLKTQEENLIRYTPYKMGWAPHKIVFFGSANMYRR